MKKSLLTLSLLGLLGLFAQASDAACTINGVAKPFIVSDCPTCCPAVPVCAPACPVATCCPAAPIIETASTVEKVPIKKKHWWNLKRDGYRAIVPGLNCGAAAPVDACGVPIAQLDKVLIPKKHFWESDKVQCMQFCPSACCPVAPSCSCGCGCQ